jgi:hypothetical protein
LKREEFDEHYHLRSNSEATHSAIKRKLGEALLSRDPQARINELLAKLLDYNIGVLIHEIFEHHIDPGVPGLSASPPANTTPAIATGGTPPQEAALRASEEATTAPNVAP